VLVSNEDMKEKSLGVFKGDIQNIAERIDFMLKHDDKFKRDAIIFFLKHGEMSGRECAKKFGVSYSTLARWYDEYDEWGEIDRIAEKVGWRGK